MIVHVTLPDLGYQCDIEIPDSRAAGIENKWCIGPASRVRSGGADLGVGHWRVLSDATPISKPTNKRA
jgi:hypothetical protein